MNSIWTMGEMIVEIMRPDENMKLDEPGVLLGPFPSGAPAIFIDVAAKLGKPAGIIGGVGKDDFGKCLLDRLEGDGVNCNFVSQEAGSTGVAFVTYFSDGSRKFIFHIDGTPAAKVQSPDLFSIKSPTIFHLMGCSLTVNTDFYQEIISTMEKFIDSGAKLSFDPNVRPELLAERNSIDLFAPVLNNCSILLPGEDELKLIMGAETVSDAVDRAFQYEKMEIIAMKRGSRGSTIFTREEKFEMGVYPIIPKDATGAGDCFDAAFICSYLDALPLKECAQVASAAAALNTQAFGPMEGDISPGSIAAMINQYPEI